MYSKWFQHHFKHSFLQYVVQGSEKELSTFYDWLQCYMKDGMKNLVDHNGRTIWFWSDPGPMKPANSKSRTLNKSQTRKRAEKAKTEGLIKDEKPPIKKIKPEEFSPIKTRRQRKST